MKDQKTKKNSFILYHSYQKHLEDLSDAEVGQLIRAIFHYSETGEVSKLKPLLKMAFNFIREDIDINKERYEEKCRKNKENIKKRWNKENTNVYDRIRSDTKDTDNDNDNDNVNDNDNDIHISKDIGVNTQVSSNNLPKEKGKPRTYGSTDINVCTQYLQSKLGASLDGSVKENRQYCYNLLRKMKKDYPNTDPVIQVKMLIDLAMQDRFHRKNATGFKYLYYNAQRIAQSFKSDYGIGENNSDIQVI